jgi:ubiquinone/menaquinone biosynthesis C-methylase UbiE
MTRTQILVWGLALAASIPAASWAQRPRHPVSGRLIAPVMSVEGAPWLERAEREDEERPKLAVQLLKLQPGMTVADVGAGSGYYTELLSRAVGPQGKVYATEIQSGMVDLLRQRVARRKLSNVEVILSTTRDPKLPQESIDMAIMVDVYHELAFPQEVLRNLKNSLKSDGRLVLLEFRGEDPSVPIRPEHKMTVADVRLELEHEGFQFMESIPGLPWQHVLVFRK